MLGQLGKVIYEYDGNPTAEQVAFIERQQWPLPEGVSLQDPDFATAIHTGKHSRFASDSAAHIPSRN